MNNKSLLTYKLAFNDKKNSEQQKAYLFFSQSARSYLHTAHKAARHGPRIATSKEVKSLGVQSHAAIFLTDNSSLGTADNGTFLAVDVCCHDSLASDTAKQET